MQIPTKNEKTNVSNIEKIKKEKLCVRKNIVLCIKVGDGFCFSIKKLLFFFKIGRYYFWTFEKKAFIREENLFITLQAQEFLFIDQLF